MITLNDYLYSGDTVMRILKKYKRDLGRDAALTGNEIDMIHCDFLQSIIDLLEHNEFLTAQSQKIREFYMYMAQTVPLAGLYLQGPHQIPDPGRGKIQRLYCQGQLQVLYGKRRIPAGGGAAEASGQVP